MRFQDAARDGRAIWHDFPGFAADLSVSAAGEEISGKVTIDDDGTVSLEMPKSPAAEWVEEQLNSLVQDQVQPLRRSMLDLNSQIDALRAEVASLRGTNERLARDLADTQRKLTDQSQSVDARLKPLEPQKVSLDGREFQVGPDERSQYEAAIGLVRRGDFAEAVAALNAFLKRYPASGYTDSVRFWLGNAQYGKRDYKDAIATFRAFISGNPEHPRAAEALLALGNCQIELKDNKGARRTFEDLAKSYPGTEAAQAGKERLATLK